MRKTIYTLNVDNYSPEITNLTYPLIDRYAKKIDAKVFVIDKRVWPSLPPVYEKLQIHELSKRRNDDWSIYIDSDALVHPDFFDVTELIPRDTIVHNGIDLAGNRWRYDNYFRRDGRHISSCNWLAVASEWCRDLWKPLDDITYEQAIENIFPTVDELNTVITREHLIDDYVLSRNIAKYGLKVESVINIKTRYNDTGDYLFHLYTIPESEKVVKLNECIERWRLNKI